MGNHAQVAPGVCPYSIGAGTIFRLGEQKLNDFSVGEAKKGYLATSRQYGNALLGVRHQEGEEAKNGEKRPRQSNSKYNFVQYVFFEKKVYTVYNGSVGQSPRSWEIFENFCVKSNLKVTFNCKLQNKMGEQDVLVAPQ